MDPKFLKCIYTAEAIYLKNDEAETLFKILEEMPNIISSHSHEAKELFQNTSLEKFINKNDKLVNGTTLVHYLFKSSIDYRSANSKSPHPTLIGGFYYYDLLISRVNNIVIFAVPYIQFAKDFYKLLDVFLRAKSISTNYSTIDITKLIINAGLDATLDVENESEKIEIKISEADLSIKYQIMAGLFNEKLSITGQDLSTSFEYKYIIKPLIDLKEKEYRGIVKIDVNAISFELVIDSVSKVNSYTDRHGNFRFRLKRNSDRFYFLTKAISNLVSKNYEKNSVNLPITFFNKNSEDTQ